MGRLDILSPGQGDASFNMQDPKQKKKALEAIVDLLQGGSLLVAEKPDGSSSKVVKYDPETETLTLADRTTVPASEAVTTSVAPVSGG